MPSLPPASWMMTRIFRPAAWATGTAVTPLSKMRAVSAMNDGTAQPAATRVAPLVRKLRRDIWDMIAATALLQVGGASDAPTVRAGLAPPANTPHVGGDRQLSWWDGSASTRLNSPRIFSSVVAVWAYAIRASRVTALTSLSTNRPRIRSTLAAAVG